MHAPLAKVTPAMLLLPRWAARQPGRWRPARDKGSGWPHDPLPAMATATATAICPRRTYSSSSVTSGGAFANNNGAEVPPPRPPPADDLLLSSLPFHISAAVCVERVPLITPELSSLQRRLLDQAHTLEHERSLLNGHELRHQADVRRAETRQRGDKTEDVGRTALDEEDEWKRDAETFSPAARETSADRQQDVHSVLRALHRPLRLVVKQQFGGQYDWDLPMQIRADGESLRETAERAVKVCCGDAMRINVLGNAPWAFYKTLYPQRIRRDINVQGQKVFIFKAHYISGQVKLQKNITEDFRWSLIEEMNGLLPEFSRKALKKMLFDESP